MDVVSVADVGDAIRVDAKDCFGLGEAGGVVDFADAILAPRLFHVPGDRGRRGGRA